MCCAAAQVVLVTGANKGIGFQFVRLLADKYPSWTILLGSRSQANADAAVAQLGGNKNVQALLIDVDSDDSVRAAAEQVKAKYGRVDVLVDNAGIASLDVPSYDVAKSIIATNVFGVKRVNDAFLPLIPNNGRIVIVSSEVGSRAHYSAPAALQKTLEDESLTWEQIAALSHRYLETYHAADSSHAAEFPPKEAAAAAYGVSKMFVSAYGRILARELACSERRINVQLVTPGLCATDLSAFSTRGRSSEEGAQSYMYALERDIALAGRLFKDKQELAIAVKPPQ